MKKIGCVIDYKSKISVAAWQELSTLYKNSCLIPRDLQKDDTTVVDILITLGGDGLMLHTLHRYMNLGTPVYGMNRGSIGFLLNPYSSKNLLERIAEAKHIHLHPLLMNVWDVQGNASTALAVNEVSLLRQTSQTAKTKIMINGKVRMNPLISDGLLVATTAGSSAYNFAAHGPIVPLDANVLLVTPISPFRPRRWNGAIISRSSELQIDVLEADKRPVSSCADARAFRDVSKIIIKESPDIKITLLFDPNESFEERVLSEQFRGE